MITTIYDKTEKETPSFKCGPLMVKPFHPYYRELWASDGIWKRFAWKFYWRVAPNPLEPASGSKGERDGG